MRLRLQAAVHALLADESVAGLPDAARLAAVVVFAKGAVETGRTVLWSGELAKWLGVSVSMVSHRVLPPLRAKGALRTLVVTNDAGEPVALDLSLEPVARLRRARDVRHPLALTRPELTTLMRLCQALFGPGRTPKNAAPTPPGLLAQREREQRHGAASDRLALLLLVLSCRENGWLKLCSGTLKAPELGRGAATLGLLMRGGAKAVTPAAADRMLSRLEGYGAAEVERDENGVPTGRVRLLPVAESYAAVRPGKKVPAVRPAARPRLRVVEVPPVAAPAAGPVCPDAEAVREAAAASSLPPVSTEGDLGSTDRLSEAPEGSGPAEMPTEASDAAGSPSADFHAPHAPVVAVGGDGDREIGGFSGASAAGVTRRRPGRAGAREEHGITACSSSSQAGAAWPGPGPLRREKPKTGHERNGFGEQQTGRAAGRAEVGCGRVPQALEPAALLWSRVRPGARPVVLSALREHLRVAEGWSQDPARAVEVLQQRLVRRLRVQGGASPVRDAVGWLLGVGLPQRPGCGLDSCDDGQCLLTDGPCAGCAASLATRRVLRRIVVREVVRMTPELDFDARRPVIDRQLAARTEAAAARRAEALAEHDRWEARRLRLAEERAAAERAAGCAVCAEPGVAGVCERCEADSEVVSAREDYCDIAVAFEADLASEGDVAAVRARAARELEQAVEAACPVGVDLQGRRLSNRVTVLGMLDSIRAAARKALSQCGAARFEAQRVRETEERRWASVQGSRAERAACERAVQRARERVARYVLAERLEAVRALRAGGPVRVAARP
ncbi:hypothetical protein [Kitasatospora sp. NPDC088134]|uniref:hypothetical protein n=1 Tax=Kitasatospora sp. NPDC088134 TaxID=3364071 RepID=UPI00382EA2CA